MFAHKVFLLQNSGLILIQSGHVMHAIKRAITQPLSVVNLIALGHFHEMIEGILDAKVPRIYLLLQAHLFFPRWRVVKSCV